MNENVQKVLNENGVDKIAFYYRGTPLVDNIYTTCLFINSVEKRIESRGVAICSLRDTFNKTSGKSKSFGRAMKALTRKINSGKIRPYSRDFELVRREIKIKNEDDDIKFKTEKIAELHAIDPNLEVMTLEFPNKSCKKYSFDIPASYPMHIANQSFKYKSQFRPNPAGNEETRILEKGI